MKLTIFYSPSNLSCVFSRWFSQLQLILSARVQNFFSSLTLFLVSSFLSTNSSFAFGHFLVQELSLHTCVCLFVQFFYIFHQSFFCLFVITAYIHVYAEQSSKNAGWILQSNSFSGQKTERMLYSTALFLVLSVIDACELDCPRRHCSALTSLEALKCFYC